MQNKIIILHGVSKFKDSQVYKINRRLHDEDNFISKIQVVYLVSYDEQQELNISKLEKLLNATLCTSREMKIAYI